MKQGIVTIVLALLLTGTVSAQDSGIVTDEDALFGGSGEDLFREEPVQEDGLFEDTILVDMTDEAGVTEPDDLLLTSEAVDIGGRISVSTLTSGDVSALKEVSTDLDLKADVFLDARPAEDFRVFFKGSVTYPFDQDKNRGTSDVFGVKELFSDFQLGDTVFFRAGKQTISWGVGYFFSPGDIINLSRIDPEEPGAERTGPVSLKIHIPFSVHNGYLYLILEDFEESKMPAVAPKAEFLLGFLELGIGGYYLYDAPPAGMVTFTRPWKEFSFFGELVGSYGSDKVFVEETEDLAAYPPGWAPVHYDDTFFFSGTAGIQYMYSDADNRCNISLAGQYYYNGEGYRDPAVITDNKQALAYLAAEGEMSTTDLVEPSRHYGAASLAWNDILDTDFSLSTFWMGSFADASGRFTSSVSFALNTYFSFSLGLNRSYGSEGAEFTPDGGKTILTLGATLGSGKF